MKKHLKSILYCILYYVIAFSIIAVFAVVAVNYANEKATEKFAATLQETFEEADRERAIMELSELRGRILEIERLSYNDIHSALQDELEDITSFQHFTNPYLENFVFIVPYASSIGDICEELISQIDDQIHTIRFGTEGE